ncbi:hypothetical protein BJV82DRAFT_657383 [Fennellomyces sp. T-0311]|nr:hypothetical protein BJV82DRAFT_657383 [Fennellomyces sp. T-0311]
MLDPHQQLYLTASQEYPQATTSQTCPYDPSKDVEQGFFTATVQASVRWNHAERGATSGEPRGPLPQTNEQKKEELEQPVRNARVLLPDCRNGTTALEAGTSSMSGSPCTSSFRGARWATTLAGPKTTSMMTRTGGTGLQAHIYDRALTRHAASRDVVCTVHDYSPGRIFVVEAEPLVEQTDMGQAASGHNVTANPSHLPVERAKRKRYDQGSTTEPILFNWRSEDHSEKAKHGPPCVRH